MYITKINFQFIFIYERLKIRAINLKLVMKKRNFYKLQVTKVSILTKPFMVITLLQNSNLQTSSVNQLIQGIYIKLTFSNYKKMLNVRLVDYYLQC